MQPTRVNNRWIFGRNIDLAAFGLPALTALMLALFYRVTETPVWAFLFLVIGIDVAHVWFTTLRVYVDREVFRKNRALYLGLPLAVYAFGVLLHHQSMGLFWRVLAYIAAFHFVRQQVGWVRLYERVQSGAQQKSAWLKIEQTFSKFMVYEATLYPLIYWHTHPRVFNWFVADDFVHLHGFSSLVDTLLSLHYVGLGGYLLLNLVMWIRKDAFFCPGKFLVVISTWLCWTYGIVWQNSDFIFTVTNVVIHGIPYMVLSYRYALHRQSNDGFAWFKRLHQGAAPWTLLILILGFFAIALFEEVLWDRFVWHDHRAMFGRGPTLNSTLVAWLAPLLAVPQVTHYFLDGWVWRGRNHPELNGLFGAPNESSLVRGTVVMKEPVS